MDDSRYARQERLPQIGASGQQALRDQTVGVIGLGALGSVGADLLARAGVGRLLLIDRDIVETSNLQRQTLYTDADAQLGLPKAVAAQQRLAQVNPEIDLEVHAVDLTAENIQGILAQTDLILDGTDNFATRYLLNDYAVSHQTPYIYAGVVGTYGMFGAILPQGPCLRCTWPEPPDAAESPTCRSAGVLGPAVSVIAGWAAAEAIKFMVGKAEEVHQGYRYLDVWQGTHQAIRAKLNPDCPCCVKKEYPWLSGSRGTLAAQVICSGGAVQVPGIGQPSDLPALAARLEGSVQNLILADAFLRFSFEQLDILHFSDGRSLVRGTEDPARARAILTRTLGG
ncbi:MAG: ThiF family adenylyltransferase [Planctomycetota bacterium]